MTIYGVFGLARSGVATALHLARSQTIYAWDDSEDARKIVIGHGNIILDHYNNWPKIDRLVISPGIASNHPIIASVKDVEIICDIELFAEEHDQIIAITGTNGKSTTTALIHHILHESGIEARIGGNIGIGALEIEPIPSDTRGNYVLELSSYQLSLIKKARFHIACLANITPDHLDRHGNMENYIAAKMQIFANQHKEDFAIIAIDNEITNKIYQNFTGKAAVIGVSAYLPLINGISCYDDAIFDNGMRIELGYLPHLIGDHNRENIAISYAAARASGVESSMIIAAIRSFQGLKHRLQLIRTINGVRFFNDSKATNADATEKALKSLDCSIYWILGGRAKTSGIDSLTPYFYKVKMAYLIGEASDEFAKTLERGGVPYRLCENLEKATLAAANDATDGSAVLLSPAAASFDQWKDFEARGDGFISYINKL